MTINFLNYQAFLVVLLNSYLILASVLEDLDKLKEAELSVRKAIQIKPDFAEAHYKLGNTLKDKGKLIEAELSIRKAIKLNPELINAYTSLGKVLKVLEELDYER